MRVLFPMRCDALAKPGGDTIQILRYIEELKKYGVEGAIAVDPSLEDLDFDIAHLSNIDRPMETLVFLSQIIRKNKHFVISSIHHSYKEIEAYESFGRNSKFSFLTGRLGFYNLEKIRAFFRTIRGSLKWLPHQIPLAFADLRLKQKLLLNKAAKVLVLNYREKSLLETEIGWNGQNFHLLPNGLENYPAQSDSVLNEQKTDILCVGRIEARKNQLSILEAAESLGLSVSFVGALNPNHGDYCRKFLSRIANSQSRYLPAVPRSQVLQLMQRAKCHVSASWFEVSSLVDFEAYANGCNIVSSTCGGTQEILGNSATYCNPGSVEDIKRAIFEAYKMPQNKSIKIPAIRTWEQVAEDLHGVYKEVLSA